MIHPNNRKKVFFGYSGSSVGACDIFKFGKCSRFDGDTEGYVGIKGHYGMSKVKTNPGWRKLRVTVEVVDE